MKRICILYLFLALVLSACSGNRPITAGSWYEQVGPVKTDEGEQGYRNTFTFSPENENAGTVHSEVIGKSPVKGMGTVHFLIKADGKYTVSDKTLTMEFDMDNAQFDSRIEANSFLGMLGSLGNDFAKDTYKDHFYKQLYPNNSIVLENLSVRESIISGKDPHSGAKTILRLLETTQEESTSEQS